MDSNKALLVIQHQLKELDSIYQDTMEMSLNTVAGTERVAKWRVRTIALLTESVDEKAAQEFARLQPGMASLGGRLRRGNSHRVVRLDASLRPGRHQSAYARGNAA